VIAAVPNALLDEVRALYEAPGRAYHTWEHVEEVLGWLDRVNEDAPWSDALAVTLAALFHDAVYVPGRADNEIESAKLARAVIAAHLPGTPAGVVARVEDLVELTARHGHVAVADVDDEAARFLDADMAILGAPPERFAAYDVGIGREYAALAPDVFAEGRRRFLEGLLASPRIFLSPWFHDRLEAPARANLRAALAR
jgi:predicted metal-dependent HD superfamily phosphohydrolase